MSSTTSLTEAEQITAMATGAGVEGVTAMKAVHGKAGLAGVPLLSLNANPPGSRPNPGRRQTSPFPDADGKYHYDEDDEDDPMHLKARPIGVSFPKRATVAK